MQDFEKLGVFYLGRESDAAGKDLSRCLMVVACVDRKTNRAIDWPDDAKALFYEVEPGGAA